MTVKFLEVAESKAIRDLCPVQARLHERYESKVAEILHENYCEYCSLRKRRSSALKVKR